MVAIRRIDPIAFSGIGSQSEGLLRAGEDAKHRGGELLVAIERRTNGCERPQQSPRLFSVFSCCLGSDRRCTTSSTEVLLWHSVRKALL
ncbi:hypothetical protein ACQX17_09725, partial [Corynebacterium diphtheriae]